jgi:hypothetical protein
MKNTITVNGITHNCEIVDNYYVMVNGQKVTVSYRQGRYGSKIYTDNLTKSMCKIYHDGSLSVSRYWNNSDRQVKDPNAYLVAVNIPA